MSGTLAPTQTEAASTQTKPTLPIMCLTKAEQEIIDTARHTVRLQLLNRADFLFRQASSKGLNVFPFATQEDNDRVDISAIQCYIDDVSKQLT